MTEQPRTLARFDNFRGGHFGNIDPALAPANTYGGRNATLYSTGLLGPRTGLTDDSDSDGTTATPGTSPQIVLGIEYLENDPRGSALPFTDGQFAVIAENGSPMPLKLYYRQHAGQGGSWTLCGTTGSLGTIGVSDPALYHPAFFTQGANNFLTYVNVAGRLYKYDVRTPTVDPVAITLPFELANIVKYGDFLVGADVQDQTNRIYWSELTPSGPDFDSWPALNFLDVGDSYPITAMFTTTVGLLVGKITGWWYVTGVLGDSPDVRKIANGGGPAFYRMAALRADGTVAVLAPDGTPGIFDGGRPTWFPEHRILNMNGTSTYARGSVIVSDDGRRTFYFGLGIDSEDESNRLMVRVLNNETGAWESWSWDYAVIGDSRTGAPNIAGSSLIPSTRREVQLITNIIPPHIVALRYDVPKPAYHYSTERSYWGSNSNTLGSGDLGGPAITAEVAMPAIVEPNGRRMRVHGVRVNLKRWNLERTALTPNVLRCKVRYIDASDGVAESEWATMEWSEPAPEVHPVTTQHTFSFDPRHAAGFQVMLELVGVAIRDVQVLGTIEGAGVR